MGRAEVKSSLTVGLEESSVEIEMGSKSSLSTLSCGRLGQTTPSSFMTGKKSDAAFAMMFGNRVAGGGGYEEV